MDDEISNLIEQLDTDDIVTQLSGPSQPSQAADETSLEPLDDDSDGEPNCQEGEEQVLRPVDVRELGDLIQPSAEQEVAQSPTQSVDISKYHKQLEAVTDEVLRACRSDRQETQDVIGLLRSQIDDAINKGVAPNRMWVDGLVQAVEVKANINSTAVKIMEANAKMLAATKSGINILNQNVQSGGDPNLSTILDQPLGADEEF